MPSAWIQHVKKYASQHNITYKEALKLSKPSYSAYGTVSTDPSTIKFNLNDEQYNLTAIKINPAFRKGDITTHNVNVKYKSDETINKEPKNTIIQHKIYNPYQRPKRQPAEYNERPEPESNIYDVNEIIEPTKTRNKIIQHKIYNPYQRPKQQPAEYNERPEPESNVYDINEIIEPTKTRNKIIQHKIYNPYQRPKRQLAEYNINDINEIIEPTKTRNKIIQHKIYNPYQRPKRQPAEYTERPEAESNIYDVNEIIEPTKTKTKNKFIINDLKHNKNISKINAKYEKIKNTDMSKYLNKKPVMKKSAESTKNEYFSFLNEPPPQSIRLPLKHPYYNIMTLEGIIPFDLIETPELKTREEQTKFLNGLLSQHKNLLKIIYNGKMENDDKKTLINECMVNIQTIEELMNNIDELKKLEDIEINKIAQNKKIYDANIKVLKSKFETAENKKKYDTNIKALKSKFEKT
jgi:hypothetical protein